MRMCKGVTVLLLGVIAFSTLICCSNKKCTSPTEPAELDFYLMEDYFPLNESDQWTWEANGDTIPEPFEDGDINLGEPYFDMNKNGVYDFGEQYYDLNFNGKYDGPNDTWTPDIPYDDRNHNGQYDPPDGIWDSTEYFIDYDGNHTWNILTKIILSGSIINSDDHLKIRETRSWGYYGDFGPWNGRWMGTDAFSNDMNGLLWHRHIDTRDFNDLLATLDPILIAHTAARVGDTIINIDPSDSYSWISIFEVVENITILAGTFQNSLKFKSLASGWTGNMQRYNGTSYQWYAKGVGLVKSEGPAEGEHWLLKSANIGGKNYP